MCSPILRWRNWIPSRKTHITLAEAKGDVRDGLGLGFEGGGEMMGANRPGLLALVYTIIRGEGTVDGHSGGKIDCSHYPAGA